MTAALHKIECESDGMTAESFLDGKVVLHPGDCLEVMDTLAENSIDACVCDPPYHLQSIVKRFAKTGRTDKTRTTSGPHQRTANGFMNKMWDGGDIAFRPDTWERVYRVLKPGAYIVAFSSTRTFGRMSVALDDAGFITHPFVAWIFGQGFPKAHKVHADEWEGWRYGTQSLKPAIEPIYVGQKPFESGLNGTQNIFKWGTGALNIDGCRVGVDVDEPNLRRATGENGGADSMFGVGNSTRPATLTNGRWPANVIHDGSDEVVGAFPDAHGAGAARVEPGGGTYNGSDKGDWGNIGIGQKGFRIGDHGSVARFFYTAKADSDDRLGSKHPTVKPLDLIEYLERLVTPPGGTILDPFAGTGTAGEAAWRMGFKAILIEREAEYQSDIRRRMALCLAGPDERAREAIKARNKDKPVDAGPLFA